MTHQLERFFRFTSPCHVKNRNASAPREGLRYERRLGVQMGLPPLSRRRHDSPTMADPPPDWPPRRCTMPDLPPGGTAPYLGQILRGRGFFGEGADALGSVFCRLVAQAVDEYRLARESITDYLRGDASEDQAPPVAPESAGANTTIQLRPAVWRIGPLLRAGGKLENCIQVLHRCVRCLEALRKQAGCNLKIDRNLSVLRAADRIRVFRNAIEHLYDDLARDKLAPGEPHTLQVAEAEVRLREHRVEYEELAAWLKQVRDVSMRVGGVACE